MELKYYGEYPNVPEAIKHYQSLFDLKVIKNGINQSVTSSATHGNISLFNQITILMNVQKKQREKVGSFIIYFDDNQVKLYLATIAKIKENPEIKIVYEAQKNNWGTTLFKFIDKFGYNWVLEISNQALINEN